MRSSVKTILSAALLAASATLSAQTPDSLTIGYEAELIAGTGSGDFAPYYVAANRHGIITQSSNAILRVAASKPLAASRRFSYGFGAEAVAGCSSDAGYLRFNPASEALEPHSCAPPALWLQQLYGEVKYRGVFLTVGLKQHSSALLNSELASGDLTESGNSRPIPEVRVGFIDFRDIPFTEGWVQIQGELSYGKFSDNGWMKSHYNYYNWHINLGAYYTYKRCYFRTKPSQPFSLTLGMQMSGLFGGTTEDYHRGRLIRSHRCSSSLSTFLKMLLPVRGEGSEYYEGNTLGSWDIMARYRLADGSLLKAYVQKPWEDGSGIGWQNGFDGVWGLEYDAPAADAIVSGAVVEYIDFTNQSGPLHWVPGDSPGTSLGSHVSGGDQYYNNYESNSYMNYGMSIGTPFLRAPIYNTDGYMAYVDNRVRGFHAGIKGRLSPTLAYRLLGSYRKGFGDGRIPTISTRESTSLMLEATYRMAAVDGLRLKAQIAVDRGTMFGNTFGATLSVQYSGNYSFRK